MTECKLEGLVAEPYGECKGFNRKLERINNLKSEVLNIEKKDEITYKKVIELGNLLEESQRIGKDFEAENRRLKQEIERLNYRYNLLKASIDTVEYKIKTDC